MPALRVKQIGSDGVAVSMMDTEVIRGVEDVQVEFGVDTGISDNFNGLTKRYVAPNNAIVQAGQVSAVRLWVRVRAEDPEQGFQNTRTYSYADVNFTANDRYRRVLMSRTIFLRNSRGLAY
jgi:hypothetical protein